MVFAQIAPAAEKCDMSKDETSAAARTENRNDYMQKTAELQQKKLDKKPHSW